eukprot:Gb_36159 [translate_table: standard]
MQGSPQLRCEVLLGIKGVLGTAGLRGVVDETNLGNMHGDVKGWAMEGLCPRLHGYLGTGERKGRECVPSSGTQETWGWISTRKPPSVREHSLVEIHSWGEPIQHTSPIATPFGWLTVHLDDTVVINPVVSNPTNMQIESSEDCQTVQVLQVENDDVTLVQPEEVDYKDPIVVQMLLHLWKGNCPSALNLCQMVWVCPSFPMRTRGTVPGDGQVWLERPRYRKYHYLHPPCGCGTRVRVPYRTVLAWYASWLPFDEVRDNGFSLNVNNSFGNKLLYGLRNRSLLAKVCLMSPLSSKTSLLMSTFSLPQSYATLIDAISKSYWPWYWFIWKVNLV